MARNDIKTLIVEKTIQLLRVPIAYCELYKQHGDILIYFTITESVFNRILDKLGPDAREYFSQWDYDDIISCAELDDMHDVYYLVEKEDIVDKKIICPLEFTELYSNYLQNKPFIIDKANRRWKITASIEDIEDFIMALKFNDFNLTENLT